MARTKAFDRDAVLDRAMDLFWKQGFEATSVQELVEVTGINRGSMYDTFGDKRELFIQALTRYADKSAMKRLEILNGADRPLDGIRAFFDSIIAASTADETKRLGCLMTNSAIEMSVRDPEIGDMLRDRITHVEMAFHKVLKRARKGGDIPKTQNIKALARFLTSTIQGVRVLARAGSEPEVLRQIVDVAMNSLQQTLLDELKANAKSRRDSRV